MGRILGVERLVPAGGTRPAGGEKEPFVVSGECLAGGGGGGGGDLDSHVDRKTTVSIPTTAGATNEISGRRGKSSSSHGGGGRRRSSRVAVVAAGVIAVAVAVVGVAEEVVKVWFIYLSTSPSSVLLLGR